MRESNKCGQQVKQDLHRLTWTKQDRGWGKGRPRFIQAPLFTPRSQVLTKERAFAYYFYQITIMCCPGDARMRSVYVVLCGLARSSNVIMNERRTRPLAKVDILKRPGPGPRMSNMMLSVRPHTAVTLVRLLPNPPSHPLPVTSRSRTLSHVARLGLLGSTFSSVDRLVCAILFNSAGSSSCSTTTDGLAVVVSMGPTLDTDPMEKSLEPLEGFENWARRSSSLIYIDHRTLLF